MHCVVNLNASPDKQPFARLVTYLIVIITELEQFLDILILRVVQEVCHAIACLCLFHVKFYPNLFLIANQAELTLEGTWFGGAMYVHVTLVRAAREVVSEKVDAFV